MSNTLIPFESPEFGQTRAFVDEHENRWFVCQDVARSLGYAVKSNPARLFACVPERLKGVKPIHTLGGVQEMLCVSESGLYFFLGRSDKPTAQPYQEWIAEKVVPSIVEKGFYVAPGAVPLVIPKDAEELAHSLEFVSQLSDALKICLTKIKNEAELVEYALAAQAAPGECSARVLAGEIGRTGTAMSVATGCSGS
jgi:prophage antirepressor-like protein